jgi:hypothetical protein
VPRSSRTFQGLLTDAPKPLPDDDEPQPTTLSGTGRHDLAAAAQDPVSAPESAAAAAEAHAGELGGQPASRPEPTRPATGTGTPPPSSSAGPTGEVRAAMTIRLRPQAAAALNSAWLDQRMHVNPKLSYPEFASEIVRLGLAAFERQAKRSSGASQR